MRPPLWYRIDYWAFTILARLFVGYRVEGQHHEPPPPFIVIANHNSAFDIAMMGINLRAWVTFVAKGEMAEKRVVRAWLHSSGSFCVRRGEPDRAAVRKGLEVLRRGGVLGIFAEGTRSPDGRMRHFEEGAAYWALRAGVPVLPMGIAGSHRAMPAGAKWPRRSPVVVRIGPPIPVPKVEGRLTREIIMEWTRRFEEVVAALLPPDQQPLPGEVKGASAPQAPAAST